MKIDQRQLSGVLNQPERFRIHLLYGPDQGLISERADDLVRAAVGTLNDPFRVSDLIQTDPEQLLEEAQTQSLLGGRRLVRVREATDALVSCLTELKPDPEGTLIVLEAGDLGPRSKLRIIVEKSTHMAAIPCYPDDEKGLRSLIAKAFTSDGISVTEEALAWLTQHLGVDRQTTRAELAKLALYVGINGVVDLRAAQVSVGDWAGLSVEDALFAATRGDAAGTDRAVTLAFAEGTSSVAVLRAAQAHLDKLCRISIAISEDGLSAADAVKSLRPPIFFRRVPAMTEAARLWSFSYILKMQKEIRAAEQACKETHMPDQLICHRAILRVATVAQDLRDRQS